MTALVPLRSADMIVADQGDARGNSRAAARRVPHGAKAELGSRWRVSACEPGLV